MQATTPHGATNPTMGRRLGTLCLALALAGAGCAAPSDTAAPVGEYGAEGVGYGHPDHAAHVTMIDEIMMEPVREGRIAGGSVAVVHRGETVAIRGYGWANVELRVPTPEDAIYETGSVTKQFTSVGLLQMQEQGLVDLDADMSDYLPDFPTQGNRITVRELLDHTSGIRGYTEMEEARPYFVRRVPRDSLLALVAAHPFDFPTGEHEIYNNSAFYLAGMILEDASGMSYEDYVEQRIFAPLGMDRSHYCSETEIHEGKVTGYDTGQDGLVHKGFIVHNVPFAAGSLCASAGDLATWLGALHGGEVLTDESYAQLIEPGDLNDGTKLRYALGIAVADIMGHRAIHHGGGINGFLTESLYLPDEDLAIAVLVNTAGPVGPSALARQIIEAMVGDHTPEPMTFDGDLAYFEGVYGGPARGGTAVVRIAAEGGVLTATPLMVGGQEIPEDGQEASNLDFRGGTMFSDGGTFLTFEGEGESATVLRYDTGGGYTVMQRR
ncbi:MAG: beta-lactamase family protein [Gemmatimonadetes bacterium]|nr:beta-lactamase family protein [Gemmatimonadota bacterium]MYC92703.1 beta-lactamase family protein [Gemmatimonadota bacterium]MYG34881.1 beta-lactamase family protein [Gemmatimonadota bacterium]